MCNDDLIKLLLICSLCGGGCGSGCGSGCDSTQLIILLLLFGCNNNDRKCDCQNNQDNCNCRPTCPTF